MGTVFIPIPFAMPLAKDPSSSSASSAPVHPMRGVVGLRLFSSRCLAPLPLRPGSAPLTAVRVWIGGGFIGAASRLLVLDAVVLVLALLAVEGLRCGGEGWRRVAPGAWMGSLKGMMGGAGARRGREDLRK